MVTKHEIKLGIFRDMIENPPDEHPALGKDLEEFYSKKHGVDKKQIEEIISELKEKNSVFNRGFQKLKMTENNNVDSVVNMIQADPLGFVQMFYPYSDFRSSEKYASRLQLTKWSKVLEDIPKERLKEAVTELRESIMASKSGIEEREHLNRIYVDYGISPMNSSIIANALQLQQATRETVFMNAEHNGFRSPEERYKLKRKRELHILKK